MMPSSTVAASVVIRSLSSPRDESPEHKVMPRREWLVTNGLGGYASGTVAGLVTRRYHGVLVAALPAPLGRIVMLNHLLERVRLPNRGVVWLGDEDEVAGPNASRHLTEFRLEFGLPAWVYDLGGAVIEKRVLMPYGQNTVHVTYRLVEGESPVRLTLRPSIHFRRYEAPVDEPTLEPCTVTAARSRYEISSGGEFPPLRLTLRGRHAALTLDERGASAVPYEVERSRGYPSTGSLWSPGYCRADLTPEAPATLIASTESWEIIEALEPEDATAAEIDRRRRLLSMAGGSGRAGLSAELVLAADQFIITPAGRVEEAARARAAGDDVRTVIAGYHWFTDWGRDTMISLEGLTLCTRRHREAACILRTFAHYVRDGLIPNMFPDGSHEGLYHTADATLWFFHALERFVRCTGDEHTLRSLLPTMIEIVERHLAGTRFGIVVDAADGLLHQGAPGYQLTWMDAKVDDWVVTPRRGKAVEINALWYNALCLLDGWIRRLGVRTQLEIGPLAQRAQDAFNARFWYAHGGYLYDVVDGEQGDDAACRPNQILAVSLDHPVLAEARWRPVVEVVRERLLTPVGLRSLAPGHPDYKSKYYGDLRSRDAAYHQGTVWGWLIGPFVDAWLRVHPGDRSHARQLLAGFDAHLSHGCVGSISEIFDAEQPYVPRGCVAQAWSVAEVLRALAVTEPGV
ncbi:MAG TPA: amylo-alpha-1,6-glucosidase [Vicinamibacterales bacterium]|nr:amylo-alpha-1,6-glucosidase [Vicinamibacterales bacterium]